MLKQTTRGDSLTREEVPVKTVDEQATVEERLTTNVKENILPSRYLKKDSNGEIVEDAEGMFRRVARDVAEAEREFRGTEDHVDEWTEKFYNPMSTLELIPNSPALMNMGDDLEMGSACFVLNPEDDMSDILDTARKASLVFQRGGGLGYSFSKIRPKGDIVSSTGGIASGPVSFMDIFDSVCGCVAQAGVRRGAQMALLKVNHPDVLRFCVCKRREGELTGFNISVGVTEDFMDAYRNDEEYDLINPRTDEQFITSQQTEEFYSPDYENDDGVESNFWRDFASSINGVSKWRDEINVEKGDPMTLPAGFIFDVMVDGAWRNGEPGCYFIDRANDDHSFNVDEYPEHSLRTTNPCFTGDTLISTTDGLQKAEKLYQKGTSNDVVVDSRLSEEPVREASSVFKTGHKKVFKLKTEAGYEVRLTANHQVMTEDGWVEVKDLSEGDEIHIQKQEGGFGNRGSEEMGRVLGWLVGDGYLQHEEEKAVLSFYDSKNQISQEICQDVNDIIRDPITSRDYEVGVSQINRNSEQRVGSKRLYEIAQDAGLTQKKLQVPDNVMSGNREMATSFISSLFSADGHVENSSGQRNSIRLSSISAPMLKDVQRLLLNFGIFSRIYEDRKEAGVKDLPDGKGGLKQYDVQALHQLVISKESMQKFADKIGFLTDDKQDSLEEMLDGYSKGPYSSKFKTCLESISYDGEEDVYDITEPSTNSLVGNGVVIHNCGEQSLEHGDSCNLMHINLSLMVKEDAPLWKDYDGDIDEFVNQSVDWDRIGELSAVAERFLDNLIERNEYPVSDISDRSRSLRKTGVGIMGFAHMLVQLGVEYGTEESLVVARKVMKHIKQSTVAESHRLATKRGSFDFWSQSKYSDPIEYPEWFEKHTGADPENYIEGFEMRGYKTTSIAPTGTTSQIGKTSGGCEPIYNVAYLHNAASDIGSLVVFDEMFLSVAESNGYNIDELKEEAASLMDKGEFSIDKIVNDEVASLFKTADEVSSDEHVKIQAAFQEHTGESISKTCNLPNSATRDDVRNIYSLADELSLKSITVYRDGSRQNQVKTTRKENNKLDEECPECGETLVMKEGCESCPDCFFEKCEI